jgi:hypothetical protein
MFTQRRRAVDQPAHVEQRRVLQCERGGERGAPDDPICVDNVGDRLSRVVCVLRRAASATTPSRRNKERRASSVVGPGWRQGA